MSWQKVKLGDVASFVNGYAFKPSDWSQAGMEIIRIQNLTKSSGESNYFLGKLDERYKVIKGDILISWSATLGCYEWNGSDAWLNQHIFKVVFNKRKVDKAFFKYLINYVLDELKQQVHGATMKHITKDKFDNTLVPLPPLDVQKKIADILDKADTLRRKDAELIKKYDELAQSIFIDMFGDPVTNPKGWEKLSLGDICHSIKDGPHVSPKYTQAGIPFISVNNVINGSINISNCKYISEEDFEKYSKKSKPEFGDILYTKGGTTGIAKIVDVDFEFMNWVHIAVLKFSKEQVNTKFMESMLNSEYCYRQSQYYTRGIANRDIVLSQIAKIMVAIPPLPLQIKYMDIIQKLELIMFKCNTDNSEQLFQSLLQRAFNGELVH